MFSCTSDDDATLAKHSGCLCHTPDIHRLTRRINLDVSRRSVVAGIAASIASLASSKRSQAQSPASSAPRTQSVLFNNVRVFDGTSAGLRDGLSVLVQDQHIRAVTAGNPAAPGGARVIDCGGRVLMPGLIDMHWHAVFAAMPLQRLVTAEAGAIFLTAGVEAERTLMRGFTTVRDAGGPVFPLKDAIDTGLIAGPRIYPSGAMITTTGGHGDMRPLSDLPRRPGGPLSALEQTGGSMIADSADEVRLRVREQLMQGASQIKIVGSGGVSSPRSPLDMMTFSEAELRAAVGTAADWNTYVMVHAYTPAAISRAIAAGVGCIEHAHLMDAATARTMAESNTWLSIQPFLSDDDAITLPGPSRAKMQQVFAGTDTAYKLAKTHGVRTAFGSDLLFSDTLTARQGTMLTHLSTWYNTVETLSMATAVNGELLALSGPRNPYSGKLGVIEEGALADLLLVDGNPLQDIRVIADPDRNFVLIMKDGRIHKNTILL
jgi:imidazolonepropionase-like amidohydrolase